MNGFAKVFLKKGEEREVSEGFPWVYDSEIAQVKSYAAESAKASPLDDSGVEDGSVVEVYAAHGAFLGCGVLNKKSRIAVRLISKEHASLVTEDIAGFWHRRVKDACDLRSNYFSDKDSYRVIFGEADLIPGLIAERYCASDGVYLVAEFLSLSCEVFREELLSALKDCLKPDFILERCDAAVREKEGLERRVRWVGCEGRGVIQIEENRTKVLVDIAGGQKTGYFLDQKFNRARIKRFCTGRRVLDAFCHTGAFGLAAVSAGARGVVSVDISEAALDIAKKNFELNGFEGASKVVCKDAFDMLKEAEAAGEKFDIVILDPPAFAKSARSIEKAYGGYKEINLRAMRLLAGGAAPGILVTCSCSYYFDENTFYSMLVHAARDAHVRLQILERSNAAPDHPILAGYPKSNYLKCAICRVI